MVFKCTVLAKQIVPTCVCWGSQGVELCPYKADFNKLWMDNQEMSVCVWVDSTSLWGVFLAI